jgi:hypothetical protein
MSKLLLDREKWILKVASVVEGPIDEELPSTSPRDASLKVLWLPFSKSENLMLEEPALRIRIASIEVGPSQASG